MATPRRIPPLAFVRKEVAALNAKLADPNLFAHDPAAGAALAKQRAVAGQALAEAEEASLAASAALD